MRSRWLDHSERWLALTVLADALYGHGVAITPVERRRFDEIRRAAGGDAAECDLLDQLVTDGDL